LIDHGLEASRNDLFSFHDNTWVKNLKRTTTSLGQIAEVLTDVKIIQLQGMSGKFDEWRVLHLGLAVYLFEAKG